MQINEINRAIINSAFTNEELASIIDAVKFARSKLGRQTMWNLKRGDQVSFIGRKGNTVIGKVVDIKIKNVIVFDGFTNWRVPANMLTSMEVA